MSPLVIIALTALGVLFLLLLVLIGGALIYLFLRAYRIVEQFKGELAELIIQLKTQQAETHKELMGAVVKINGDELGKAVSTFVEKMREMAKFVSRAENAALAMGEMCKVIVNDNVVRSNVGAEEFAKAEAGERFISQSAVAAADADELGEMGS